VLEHSNDPRDYGLALPVRPPVVMEAPPTLGSSGLAGLAPAANLALAPTAAVQTLSTTPPAAGVDLASDARLLADYGDPPRHWILTPVYAWRVFKRRRELRSALAKRREESSRTASEAEDALVAFGEHVRPTAERHDHYGHELRDARRAEEILRSRDKVLASEQDAHNARLAQVDARLTKLEEELATARGEERATAAELTATQGALARQEAKLKRAESELRSAQKTLVEGGTG
jgi:hypothetical protein